MAGKYRDDSHIPTVSSSGRLYRYLYCFWEVLCFENRAFCDSLISLLFFPFFFSPSRLHELGFLFKVQKGSELKWYMIPSFIVWIVMIRSKNSDQMDPCILVDPVEFIGWQL
ncbi:hypothetical protein NC652_039104 [Populus alba x Populus x berolinensis]|nr:hypothetical protein NC652_039104 [Populus alba x Populus x berolinensis]